MLDKEAQTQAQTERERRNDEEVCPLERESLADGGDEPVPLPALALLEQLDRRAASESETRHRSQPQACTFSLLQP